MAEREGLVNNAQMASRAGHPLWGAFVAAIKEEAAKGTSDPLLATGPHLLTRVLRVGTPQPWSSGAWPADKRIL
jgi:hypothetical protein